LIIQLKKMNFQTPLPIKENQCSGGMGVWGTIENGRTKKRAPPLTGFARGDSASDSDLRNPVRKEEWPQVRTGQVRKLV